MNKVLRYFAWLCAILLMMMVAANADALTEGLVQADWIEGTCGRSDDVHQTSFLLSFRYPQFETATPADEAINRYYQTLALAHSAEWLEGTTNITCEITHSSARYVSVLEITSTQGGNGETQQLRSDTFARDGMYAGKRITLSELLGLEDQTLLVRTLADELIWQIIEQEMQNAENDYLDGLTQQQLSCAYDPEEDFYLDSDGNIVFWIEAGEIAGEIAGILRFPFAEAELMSAV